MSERNLHTELWAEKLQQVTLPDSGEAWQAMMVVLDREMPVKGKKDGRRWFLLILLLLLLIGVCNCPGRGRWFGKSSLSRVTAPVDLPVQPSGGAARPGDSSVQSSGSPDLPVGSPVRPLGSATPPAGSPARPVGSPAPPAGSPAPTVGSPAAPAGGLADGRPLGPNGARQPPDRDRRRDSGGPHSETNSSGGTAAGHGENTGSRADAGHSSDSSDGKDTGGSTGSNHHAHSGRFKRSGQYSDVTVLGRRKKRTKTNNGDTVVASVDKPEGNQNHGDSTAKRVTGKDSIVNKMPAKDSAAKKVTAKDSTGKKATPPKPEKEKEDIKGFVAGIGLNQLFPVGGQERSGYNSGGTTGGLSDYIPVPMIRYYFSKKLYVQLDAQLNAPQYTKKNLVIQQQQQTLSPGRVLTNTVTVQKLFYFNLPLSIHYSPIDNLSVGAGLQFSRLRNAVGSVDSTITNTISTRVDSLISKRTLTLKNSTAYQLISTNEFRVLIDANYTYRHFIFGVRYNQALSNFVNVQVGPGTFTQARNSSLQLYLRYILWDDRKKK
jgi:hypothetical protein